MTKQLLMGNQAFAHAALEAGVNVVAGYPGTPSSELVETVAKLHAAGSAQGVHVEWSTNEKAAIEMLAGASLCGARVLFTCKQVGLNVASDPLMSLNYVGIKGGFVLFVADDPGPISSQTEQDTRRFAAFAKLPVLDPATPEDGFDMIGRAFELSEAYGTPVIVRPTTRICHASTFFDVAETTQARALPPEGFQRDSKWVIFPRRAYQAHGEVNDRLDRIAKDYASDTKIEECGTNSKLGIATGGVSDAYVREALDILGAACAKQGVNIPAYRLMNVGMPYPFPAQRALEFANGLERIIVFEELDYVIEDELLRLAGRHHLPYSVQGKLDGSTVTRGENTVEAIVDQLNAYFAADAQKDGSAPQKGSVLCPLGNSELGRADAAGADESHSESQKPAEGSDGTASQVESQLEADDVAASPDNSDTAQAEPPVRPPVLCAGCPHRGSFYAVKQALGKKPAVLCGDIGCYTLGNAQPLDAVDTCLCMGAGITMAQGFSVAEPNRKCVAFVGDSTFFASGLTGVANAVYNQHDITVCVLDNSTTAMTGGQPHPGTGITLMGPHSKPIDIEGTLVALGVKRIMRANAFDLEEARAAAHIAIDYPGPSAVIFEGPCVQISQPKAPSVVDADVCTTCRKCITSIGCPAISMDDAGKSVCIDPTLCTGCGLCQAVCPFHAIKATAKEGE